jgi:hypothetical protein
MFKVKAKETIHSTYSLRGKKKVCSCNFHVLRSRVFVRKKTKESPILWDIQMQIGLVHLLIGDACTPSY